MDPMNDVPAETSNDDSGTSTWDDGGVYWDEELGEWVSGGGSVYDPANDPWATSNADTGLVDDTWNNDVWNPDTNSWESPGSMGAMDNNVADAPMETGMPDVWNPDT